MLTKLDGRRALLAASLVVIAAVVVRLLFWNGPLGSDDVVYLIRSLDVADGTWSTATYNGALRYGFNIPEGMLLRVLGIGEWTVNAWPIFCSLAEIAVVFAFAKSLWGDRAAVISALLLAFTPLHIASATRIHADPVVALFLTLSFALFYWAERRDSAALFVATGVAMGAVFWTKELAIVALTPLLLYPLVFRRLNVRWAYVVLGGAVMLIGHFALMYAIAGDPLHLLKVVTGQVSRDFIAKGSGEDSGAFYFRYLFIDVKHTFIVPIIACAGLVLYALRRGPHRPLASRVAQARTDAGTDASRSPSGTSYVVFWCVGMILMLSFLPVSLSPMRFVMKQSNYLTLFLAPMALLAGWFVAWLPARIGLPVAAVAIAGGIVLGALEQQAYRLFTSNSRAVLALAAEHPQATIYGTPNNVNLAVFQSLIDRGPSVLNRFKAYDELVEPAVTPHAAGSAFVVLDRETWDWGLRAKRVVRIPACWNKTGDLAPSGFGLGASVVRALVRATTISSAPPMAAAHRSFEALLRPLPATVYAMDRSNPLCGQAAAGVLAEPSSGASQR